MPIDGQPLAQLSKLQSEHLLGLLGLTDYVRIVREYEHYQYIVPMRDSRQQSVTLSIAPQTLSQLYHLCPALYQIHHLVFWRFNAFSFYPAFQQLAFLDGWV